MSTLTIAVIGAGGKMGMRVSDNLQRSDHTVHYVENSPAGCWNQCGDRKEPVVMPEPLQPAAAAIHVIVVAGRDFVVQLGLELVRPEFVGTAHDGLAGLCRNRSRNRLNAPR